MKLTAQLIRRRPPEAVGAGFRGSDSPGIVAAVRFDEVEVTMFGQEGYQLIVGPEGQGGCEATANRNARHTRTDGPILPFTPKYNLGMV